MKTRVSLKYFVTDCSNNFLTRACCSCVRSGNSTSGWQFLFQYVLPDQSQERQCFLKLVLVLQLINYGEFLKQSP